MNLERIFILLTVSSVKATILSEKYNIYENSNFGTGRIILNIQLPNNIDPTRCLIECNKRHTCLTAFFVRNPDSILCELLFSPHNLTNVVVSSTTTDSTIYQKKVPTSYIGSVVLNSVPKATAIYWNRQSKYFMVKYSIDNGVSWNKTNNLVRVSDKFNRPSTINSFSTMNMAECEILCLNEIDCFHFTYFANSTCELKSFTSNVLTIDECPINANCSSLVAYSTNTFVNSYQYNRTLETAQYTSKVAFYSDDDSIWSDWYLA